MALIKNVFIDLDDTILDFHKAEAVAVRKALSEIGIEPTENIVVRYSMINAMQWRLLEDGLITREQVLVDRFRVLLSELFQVALSEEGADAAAPISSSADGTIGKAEAISNMVEDISNNANMAHTQIPNNIDHISEMALKIRNRYEVLLSQGHYFIEGAPELLETLYGKYDLYLASNGTAIVQDSRIASAGISKYFKEIFISERVGCDKPQVGFFEYCFDRISGTDGVTDFKKEETIIIGDSLSSDIMGGNNAGIYTCWFNPKGKERTDEVAIDFEVSELSEIPSLLEKCGI